MPWSVVAQQLSDANNETAFFRIAPGVDHGFKIVVSTRRDHRGVGQCIKPDTPLHQTLSELFQPSYKPREIEAGRLAGIAGIEVIQSAAAYSHQGGLWLAVIPRVS